MARTDDIETRDLSELHALLKAAATEYNAGNTADALVHCDKLIASYPENPRGFILRARSLAAERRFDEALETLRTSLPRHRTDIKLLGIGRTIAFQAGSYDLAMEFANRITELSPGDLRNRAFLVQSYVASNNWDLALSAAEELVRDLPSEALAWKVKAHVLLAGDRLADALCTLQEALKVRPEDAKLLALARFAASQQGLVTEAIEYARRLSAIAPEHEGNRAFLAVVGGDFEEILRCSEGLIADSPDDVRGWMMKADALIALHRVDEAIESLHEALNRVGRDPRLLALARNIAYSHGRYEQAVDYAVELLALVPDNGRDEYLLTRCWMAAGKFDEIGKHVEAAGLRAIEQPLRKAVRNYREVLRLREEVPALVAAWRAALDNVPDTIAALPSSDTAATVIQYWSQGAPPEDVQVAVSEWKDLVEQERIGDIKLFDRAAAEAWIDDQAPEFALPFSKAFHFAVEADIFRIAYASKRPCIYVDADDWPLEQTARILKFCVRERKSMLFFRSYKPWISNAFFISRPDSPFFRQLAGQSRAINLDEWQNNRVTVGSTFGPARYNDILTQLIQSSATWDVAPIDGLPGCSRLVLDGEEIYFSHEGVVAALKPPFMLGYKATDASWKTIDA